MRRLRGSSPNIGGATSSDSTSRPAPAISTPSRNACSAPTIPWPTATLARSEGRGGPCARFDESRHDPFDDLVMRAGGAADDEMGFGIDGVALVGEAGEHRKRILAPEQRAVPAAAYPGRQNLDLGVEPDRDAALENK